MPQCRLDDCLDKMELAPNVLLKIDVQGCELLSPSRRVAVSPRSRHALVETSFEDLYQGQADFHQVYELMRGEGSSTPAISSDSLAGHGRSCRPIVCLCTFMSHLLSRFFATQSIPQSWRGRRDFRGGGRTARGARPSCDSRGRACARAGRMARALGIGSQHSLVEAWYGKMRQLLQQHRPDIVHVHNWWPQMSPAVCYAAHSASVPVIHTLHNYRLCARTRFSSGMDMPAKIVWAGQSHGRRTPCLLSTISRRTAVVANVLARHRKRKTWSEQVDVYIALSEFARRKFIDGGLPAERTW